MQTFKANVHGAINILGLAKWTNARILQASTSEVYGDPSVSPQPESYWGNVNPIGIRSCYDEGKRAAETLFLITTDNTGAIYAWHEYSTHSGQEWQSMMGVVSNFIVQALENRDLTVYGDGSQTRSFCYVDDLISGLISLFFSDNVHEPINLGNPEPINMGELAKEIIEKTNLKSQITFQSIPSDDPRRREPDISKAKEILGWEPKISRSFGLDKTIDYFRKELAN